MSEPAPAPPVDLEPGRLPVALAALTLVLLALALLGVTRASSLTVDEASVIPSGVANVRGREVVFFPEQAPLARLAAGSVLGCLGVEAGALAPVSSLARVHRPTQWALGERFLFEENQGFHVPPARPGVESIVFAARLGATVFPLVAALVAWLWAARRFGPWGGLLALALLATHPCVLGHGALATADMPVATCALAAGFLLDRLARGGGVASLVGLGLAVGALLGAKLSAPSLVVGLAAAASVAFARPLDAAPANAAHPLGQGPPARRASALALGTLVVAALAYLTLALLFLGHEPVGAYLRATAAVRAIHHAPYEGYLLGELRTGRWWHYGFTVLLLKAPLGSLALGALALVGAARDRALRGRPAEEAILHLPPLVFLGVTSLLAAPIGSRYFLAVVPFACVSAGRAAVWARGSRRRAAVILGLLGLSFAGAVRDFPFPATALNRLAGSRELAWRVLDDSNVDWGGGLRALGEWQRARAIERVVVVPFGEGIMHDGGLVEREGWVGRLAAWGVVGEVSSARALFEPEPGRVYAVSAHVLAHAWATSREWQAHSSEMPRLVLGAERMPSEVVGGGFVIFDLR